MLIGENIPKENIDIIKFKFVHGVYSIDKLIFFVKTRIITKEDFKNITRYDYDGYLEIIKKGE